MPEEIGVAEVDFDSFVFPWSVSIMGLLHILHTCCKQMTESLEAFDPWMACFRDFVKYFHCRPQKEGVIEACFSKPPACWYAREVKLFDAPLMDERWGYLCTALLLAEAVDGPLVCHFDEDAINTVGGKRKPANPASGAPDKETSPNMQRGSCGRC